MTERSLVASLPMYDWPEVRWAHDALWSAIAARLETAGIPAPKMLDRSRPSEDVWCDPSLVLSQTCGWPFVTRLLDRVKLVGTPHYRAEGCTGPYYSTTIVVRKDDPAISTSSFRGTRAAFNSHDSLSGFVAFRSALRKGWFGFRPDEWIETGSHRASLRAVAEGRADIASLDAICWDLAKRFEPDAAEELKVLSRTPLRPGLPLITALNHGAIYLNALRAAIIDAMQSDQLRTALEQLGIAGFSVVGQKQYRAVATIATDAGPKPTVLPSDSSDEEILNFVRDWCEVLNAGDYLRAYFMTRHRWDMTPWMLRTLIECFGWTEPPVEGRIFKVTSPVTAKVAPGDKTIADLNRWGVSRRSEPLTHDQELVGYVHYDLPLNGYWSDLTAEFNLISTAEGIVLELESIHVM